MTTTQTIKCPECGKIQQAEVKEGIPFDIYIHECTDCGYLITESDWDVQTETEK